MKSRGDWQSCGENSTTSAGGYSEVRVIAMRDGEEFWQLILTVLITER